MVVGGRGRIIDQLLTPGAGHFAITPAGRSLAAAGREFWLLHRLHHGCDVTSATFHRKHDHSRPADRGRFNLGQCAAVRHGCGQSCWRPISPGTLFAALFCTYTPVLSPQIYDGMLAISRDLLAVGWWEMLFRAVAAGFLMAAMVWLMPGAERAQFHVITLITWLIAVGGFTHVVAGSMEAYLLVLSSDWAWWQMLTAFMVPVLIGNMIGGTALFALISYAQVMEEI